MRRLCVLLACLVLASCFDIREEVWVHADGSGRAKFDYRFPDEALIPLGGKDRLEAKLRRTFENSENLELDRLELTENDGELHLSVGWKIDSMLELRELTESPAFQDLPPSSREFAGTFEMKIEGLEVDFRREMNLRDALGFTAFAIGPNQRRERTIEVVIHLPAAARRHDADRTADGGRTLIWDRTLGEALDTPLVTSFVAPIPLPWWIWAAVIALLALLIALAFKLSRRFRDRKSLASPPS